MGEEEEEPSVLLGQKLGYKYSRIFRNQHLHPCEVQLNKNLSRILKASKKEEF